MITQRKFSLPVAIVRYDYLTVISLSLVTVGCTLGGMRWQRVTPAVNILLWNRKLRWNLTAIGHLLWQARLPGTRCQPISLIRHLAKTILGDH